MIIALVSAIAILLIIVLYMAITINKLKFELALTRKIAQRRYDE